MTNKALQKLPAMMGYPTKRWQKLAYKAPMLLWRLGLGPVIGHIIIVITTTGNKSKLPRHNMAEYYILNGKKYVTSGFGEKAAWYKNIQADPRVSVQTAAGTESMEAVRVKDDQELIQVVDLFNRRNPLLTNWYLDSLGIKPSRSNLLEKKDRIYIIRFDPTNEPTPPGLPTDLTWVWAVIALIILLILGLRKVLGSAT